MQLLSKGDPENKMSRPIKYILAYGIGLMGVPPFRRNARAGHFITWKGLIPDFQSVIGLRHHIDVL